MLFPEDTSTQPGVWFRPQGSGRGSSIQGQKRSLWTWPYHRHQGGKGSFDDRRSVTAATVGQDSPCPVGIQRHQGSAGSTPWDSSTGSPCPHTVLPCARERAISTVLLRILQEEQAKRSKAKRSSTAAPEGFSTTFNKPRQEASPHQPLPNSSHASSYSHPSG